MALDYPGIPYNNEIRQVYSHGRSIEKRIKDARNGELIQIPNWYFPHAGYTGALWIEIQPMKLDQINTGGRGGSYVTTEFGPTYRFLAPIDGLQETHNYEWSEYESMLAKLQNLFNNIEVGIEQFKGFSKSLLNDAWNQIKSGEMPTAGSAADMVLKAANFPVPKTKIDSPLAFTNSARRQYLINFPLLSEGLKTNLVEIMKDFQQYAAPKSEGQGYISWPHVFSLQSDPRGVLDVDIAACVSFQTNWHDPYVSGIPQRCDLTLGFTDISPLFKKTITHGSLVRVTDKETGKSSIDSTTGYKEYLNNRGTLFGEIKDATKYVREMMGYPKTNTPINP